MIKNILLIEDNKTVAKLVKVTLEGELSVEIDVVSSLDEAKKLISKKEYFLGVMGLVLPDAPNGEAVDYSLQKGLSIIILTSTYDQDTRKNILDKKVFDYIIIKNRDYIHDLVLSVKRAVRNASMHALVVDDSKVFRKLLTEILVDQLFHVHEADNGRSALQELQEHPEISLVLTDHDMPEMNGFDLVIKIRESRKFDKMAILIISAEENRNNIPLYLKHGANDYIQKPFDREEFLCRVNLNCDNLEMIENIRNLAHLDILTGLYNKKYLISIGEVLHSNAQRYNTHLALAQVDVDNFLVHVSLHGEDAGHFIIKELGQMFDGRLKRRSDVIARVAPSRFAVLVDNKDVDDLFRFFETIRKDIEEKPFVYKGGEIRITVSIGLCTVLKSDFHSMYAETSFIVEEARNRGGNQVWMD